MNELIETLTAGATNLFWKVLAAIAVFIIGKYLIRKVLELLKKLSAMNKATDEIESFVLSFVQIALWVLLAITIVSILGVPMASIVAILASAGMAIGLSLQGALSNLAGGIMLMLFKPFRVNDYIIAVEQEGTVSEITMVYTKLITADNRAITIPNGTLMNANIINYSSEKTRRVEIKYPCAKGEQPANVEAIMLQTVRQDARVLAQPAPFARVNAMSNEATEMAVLCWCKTEDYWDLLYDLNEKVTAAMIENGVGVPEVRIAEAKK